MPCKKKDLELLLTINDSAFYCTKEVPFLLLECLKHRVFKTLFEKDRLRNIASKPRT